MWMLEHLKDSPELQSEIDRSVEEETLFLQIELPEVGSLELLTKGLKLFGVKT